MPRISILMPVYNGWPHIKEAIDSVLLQTEQDWELLISDDGSTDNTRDYLETLHDPRIRVFNQQHNLGIFGNLNFLLEHAQVAVAKIFCQDDKLLPDTLLRISVFMEARPWCAVSRCLGVGDADRYPSSGRQGKFEAMLPSRIYPEASWLTFATFGNIVGNLARATCRPRLVLDAGGFDQNYPYAGDYEGWMRVSARHGIALQNEELVFVRSHSAQNSILLNRKNELFPQINKLIEMLATKVPASEITLLKRHWTYHFLARRVPHLVRQVIAGDFRLASRVLLDLPLNISAVSVCAAYPSLKLNLPSAQATSRKLLARIIELNIPDK